jgi:hypothetical protein
MEKERFKGIDIIERMVRRERFKCVSGHWLFIGNIFCIKDDVILKVILSDYPDSEYFEHTVACKTFWHSYEFMKSEFEVVDD